MGQVLDTGVTIAVFLAILVALVVIHEIGHFVVARLVNVRVHEFGIGFPPRARVLARRGETIYTLNWLPLGGFVRLEGEDGDSNDPRSFGRQSLAIRVLILAAGVAMNLLLAVVIFSVIAFGFEPTAQTRVESVTPGSPAAASGLQPGDVITRVDGRVFPYFDNLAPTAYMRDRPGQRVVLSVTRAGTGTMEIGVTLSSAADIAAGKGALGIRALILLGDALQRNPVEAVAVGAQRTVEACGLVLGALRDLVADVARDPAAAPPVSGPIGIAQAVGTVRTQAPPVVLLWLIGLLSANLAVVNILPFPPLDGGRIAVGFVQAITRGRISVSVERASYFIGFVLLFGFLLWVSYFDIVGRGSGG
jgi:regulator of sigma E protease